MTELTDCMTSFDILVTLFSVGRWGNLAANQAIPGSE
jgi:hypothetical protein